MGARLWINVKSVFVAKQAFDAQHIWMVFHIILK